MDLNGLLTIIGLVIAAYAILPRERRLNLLLHLGIIESILIFITLIAVHYFQFYKYFEKIGLAIELNSIEPKDISYLLIIFTILILMIKVKWGKISNTRIFKFQALVEELNSTDNHAVLIALLDRNLEYVLNIYKNDFPLQRLRKWLVPPSAISDKPKSGYQKWIRRIFYWLIFFIPNHEKRSSAAQNIIRTTFLNDQFAQSVAKISPYFGMKAFVYEMEEFTEFVDIYLRQLFKKQDSILYFEVKNNQNISSSHRYLISESNKLLAALFKDCKVAERLAVWKPIGEELIEYLVHLNKNKNIDEYNFEVWTFDKDFLKSPISIGIRFFDLMVTEALFQNIHWHMWLYYFPHFTENICRNFEPKVSDEDLKYEFPTKYSTILYSIISTQCDWIDILRDLPEERDNIKLERTDCSNENGNIIKSSIISLAQCLYTISETETIPHDLKKTIFSRPISQYFKLRNYREPYIDRYADALLICLLSGGPTGKFSKNYAQTLLLSVLERNNIAEMEVATKLINDIVEKIASSFWNENIEAITEFTDIEIKKEEKISYISSKMGAYRYKLYIADSA